MNEFYFSAAFEEEKMVFGAQRPAYSSKNVEEGEVRVWIDFMNGNGIRRVVCLLPQEQLEYYTSPPLDVYEKEFGRENVLWAPVEDFHLCDKETLRKILQFLKDADDNRERVVVHCSGGLGRTGHVLAAWLVFGRGFSIKDALNAVERAGRDPYEAVRYGNAEEDDLIDILEFAETLRKNLGTGSVKVALVGLGGAGTTIVQKVIEGSRINELINMYIVNAENWLESVKFYEFGQIEEVVEELSKYEHVILTAGLGSSGGDSLVYLANQLENIAAVFVTKPFRVERERVKRAEEQLRLLKCHVVVKDLNELLVKMPDAPLGVALEAFDREMAAKIVNKARELLASGGV